MKLHLIPLGCDKNLVDSEKMLKIAFDRGFTFTDEPERAEVIIVNTCCFIGDARDESVQKLLEAAELKKNGRLKALIVTGCLAERYRDDILKELPEVDAVLGTNSWQELGDVLDRVSEGSRECVMRSIDGPLSSLKERILSTGGHYAYLKIAEGCNKRCTYCIIPSLRGKYRSVPKEELLAEASALAEEGVKELILVAQETTLYGMDLYGRKALPELLEALSGIDGIRWIRILYCYPEEVTDELIHALKTLPKVCHYLDIPIQHASDRVLSAMGRRTTSAEIRERIRRMRGEIPDLVLRTTMISGFPGETEDDHKALAAFIEEMEFDRLGVFCYSREDGTAAAALPDQVPEEVKEARRAELMELQQRIAFRKAEAAAGRTLEVLIEGRLYEEEADGNVYVGRTYMDAPDVDGLVYMNTGSRTFMTGDIVSVRITAAREYDLIGELVQ